MCPAVGCTCSLAAGQLLRATSSWRPWSSPTPASAQTPGQSPGPSTTLGAPGPLGRAGGECGCLGPFFLMCLVRVWGDPEQRRAADTASQESQKPLHLAGTGSGVSAECGLGRAAWWIRRRAALLCLHPFPTHAGEASAAQLGRRSAEQSLLSCQGPSPEVPACGSELM